MICKNCGAEFDNELPKCPYCGSFHYAGAQKEYMGKLENIREDLENINEEVPEIYRTELKKQTKLIKKVLLIIAAVFAVFALLFFVEQLFWNMGGYDEKEVLLFEKEMYPIADEYFEAGDYDGLLEFQEACMEENKNAGFYNWDHFGFLVFYENYTSFFEYVKNLEGSHASDFDLQEIFYYYISSRYDQKAFPISPEDQLLMDPMIDEMEVFIDSLNLTDDELIDFNNLLNDPEYPSWDDIGDFAKKVYKRIYS